MKAKTIWNVYFTNKDGNLEKICSCLNESALDKVLEAHPDAFYGAVILY